MSPQQGPSRTLWSDIPEVVNSEFLATLSPNERRLQEAKFEILTSEASYLKSLSLLKSHFMNHPAFRDTSILSSADRKILFSFITPVQECSDRLLCYLESCWQENIMLLGMSHSIFKNAEKYFHVSFFCCVLRPLKYTINVTENNFCFLGVRFVLRTSSEIRSNIKEIERTKRTVCTNFGSFRK